MKNSRGQVGILHACSIDLVEIWSARRDLAFLLVVLVVVSTAE